MDIRNNTSFLGKHIKLTETLQQQNEKMLEVLNREKNYDIFKPEIDPLFDYSMIEGEDKNLASFMTGQQYATIYMYNKYLNYVLKKLEKSNEEPSDETTTLTENNSDYMQDIINKSLGLY